MWTKGREENRTAQLESEQDSQAVLDCVHGLVRDVATKPLQPLDRYAPDLVCLDVGRLGGSTLRRINTYVKRNSGIRRCQGEHQDKVCRPMIEPVDRHHEAGTFSADLLTSCRIEVRMPHLSSRGLPHDLLVFHSVCKSHVPNRAFLLFVLPRRGIRIQARIGSIGAVQEQLPTILLNGVINNVLLLEPCLPRKLANGISCPHGNANRRRGHSLSPCL